MLKLKTGANNGEGENKSKEWGENMKTQGKWGATLMGLLWIGRQAFATVLNLALYGCEDSS